MNCLFCFDKSSQANNFQSYNSQQSDFCSSVPFSCAEAKILGKLFEFPKSSISSSITKIHEDDDVSLFDYCNLCNDCKEKVVEVQSLIRQFEELQLKIFAVKEEFVNRLRDSSMKYNKTLQQQDKTKLNELNTYTHEFRKFWIRRLNFGDLKPEINTDKGEVSEVIQDNFDQSIIPETACVEPNISSQETNEDDSDEYDHLVCCTSQSWNMDSSSRFNTATSTDLSINLPASSNDSSSKLQQPLKDLRILITRLTDDYIESVSGRKVEAVNSVRSSSSRAAEPTPDELDCIRSDILVAKYPRNGRVLAGERVKCLYESCKRTFQDEHSKQKHIRTHQEYDGDNKQGLKPRLDKSCKKRQSLVTEHMDPGNPNEKKQLPFCCPFCSENFRSRASLAQHRKMCNPGRRSHKNSERRELSAVCPHCAKAFSTRTLLSNHLRWHRERKFECSICLKTFVRPTDLNRHMIVHTNEKPFKCQKCGKGFRTSSNHLVHTKTVCGSKSRDRFPCDECDKVYKHEETLVWHKKKHGGTAEYPFKCDLCDHRARFQSMIELHRRSHFQERNYQCDRCPALFKHKNSLTLHYDVRHLGKRGRKCDQCNYIGIDKQSLDNHIRTHSNETPFQCDACGKEFKRSHHLKRHQQTVHNRKNIIMKPKTEKQRSAKSKKKGGNSLKMKQQVNVQEIRAVSDSRADPSGKVLVSDQIHNKKQSLPEVVTENFEVKEGCFIVGDKIDVRVDSLDQPPEPSNEVSL